MVAPYFVLPVVKTAVKRFASSGCTGRRNARFPKLWMNWLTHESPAPVAAGSQPISLGRFVAAVAASFGGVHVLLGEQRGHASRFRAVVETERLLFGREGLRRVARVAEQLPHGVVVFTVRQTAER